jgi:hypothetical protein
MWHPLQMSPYRVLSLNVIKKKEGYIFAAKLVASLYLINFRDKETTSLIFGFCKISFSGLFILF